MFYNLELIDDCSITDEKSVFEGTVDQFNGVTVNLSEEFCKIEEFNSKLDGK